MLQVVNEYVTGKNKELEIRFRCADLNVFKTVFNSFKEPQSSAVVKSITLLTNDYKRKEIFYDAGKKSEEYLYKRETNYWFTDNKIFKVVNSTEETIEPFPVSAATIIRFKLRIGLTLADYDWRFDFTIVKQIAASETNLVDKYKKAILVDTTLEKFTDTVDAIDSSIPGIVGSIEAEHTGKKRDSKKISEDIDNILNMFRDAAGMTKKSGPGNPVAAIVFEMAEHILSPEDAKMFKYRFGLKELSNNPVSLSRTDLPNIIANISDYYIAEKTDGLRCFVYIQNGNVQIITAHELIETKYKSSSGVTILDAEYIDPAIQVFDALMIDGKVVTNKTFAERYDMLEGAIAGLGKEVSIKPMILATPETYCDIIKKIYKKTHTEGIIFTPKDTKTVKHVRKQRFKKENDYYDMVVYKYKLASATTIDFMVVEVPKNLVGKKPYFSKPGHVLYVLFCGINMDQFSAISIGYMNHYEDILRGIPINGVYFPIQASFSVAPNAYMYYHPNTSVKSTKLPDGAFIGEFLRVENDWKLVKVRDDKKAGIASGVSYGNNFKVAESLLVGLMKPLTVDEICSGATEGYFKSKADAAYKPLAKLNNFVKATVLKQLSNYEWVADLASGKGQDLFTYNCFNVKNLLCTDIDALALEELNNRRYYANREDVCVFGAKPQTSVRTLIAHADLSESANKNIDKFLALSDGEKFNAVVINLAIHYLIKTPKSIGNLITLVNSILSPGGKFIFTCFDGERIHKLLDKFNVKQGETWTSSSGKYSIRRDYKVGAKFSSGLQIGVRHHFGGGEYYTETLVDISELVDLFKLQLVSRGSFADYHDQFSQFNRSVSAQLHTDDLLYSSLYSYVTLKK